MSNIKRMVIFDIDGTLADNEHRTHFLQGEGPKDWEGFFNAQHLDTPREDVVHVMDMYQLDPLVHMALLTGRGEEWRQMTEDWLDTWQLTYDSLTMRGLGDRTDDDIIKVEQIKAWQAEGYEIIGLFDDRKRICDAARAHGITVFQMAEGNF